MSEIKQNFDKNQIQTETFRYRYFKIPVKYDGTEIAIYAKLTIKIKISIKILINKIYE